eukprot:3009020-Amphidinium_carterae.1
MGRIEKWCWHHVYEACSENGLFLISDARILCSSTPCGDFADWLAARQESSTAPLKDLAALVQRYCYERC